MVEAVFEYAGDVLPQQAWDLLKEDGSATLVDVRTVPEWTFSGVPDLSSLGKEVIMLSWQFYPSMQVNDKFVEQLERCIIDKDTPLLFLCRIGGRSLSAAKAMAEAGYTKCYNIADGFEGSVDAHKHRGTVAGWKAEALPWEQN